MEEYTLEEFIQNKIGKNAYAVRYYKEKQGNKYVSWREHINPYNYFLDEENCIILECLIIRFNMDNEDEFYDYNGCVSLDEFCLYDNLNKNKEV